MRFKIGHFRIFPAISVRRVRCGLAQIAILLNLSLRYRVPSIYYSVLWSNKYLNLGSRTLQIRSTQSFLLINIHNKAIGDTRLDAKPLSLVFRYWTSIPGKVAANMNYVWRCFDLCRRPTRTNGWCRDYPLPNH